MWTAKVGEWVRQLLHNVSNVYNVCYIYAYLPPRPQYMYIGTVLVVARVDLSVQFSLHVTWLYKYMFQPFYEQFCHCVLVQRLTGT